MAMAVLSASAAGRAPRWLSAGVAVLLVFCAARIPTAVRQIDRASNVRIALVDHAPMAGRFISVLMRVRPPADASLPAAGVSPEIAEVPRSLDWTGRDLLLVSVDALRADHVSAYGYPRPTTPNLDALAREGTLFESAYCPTPHTSYSITSMLTGKYLRPLANVYDMGYTPSQDQATLGAQLVKEYNILPPNQLTNCSICHR